jgi:hypothetical protein
MAEPGFKPLLSILMPTMAKRAGQFMPLVTGLLAQCEASAHPVEVVGLANVGEKSLAEYRELLLRDARGKYLCFVDDDDQVAGDYVESITAALTDDPSPWPDGEGPDVVTFWQDGTGTQARMTLFGLQFLGAPWHPVVVNGIPTYLRVYSHMQPIRAEIAKQGSFLVAGALGFTQEDQHFANSVVPLLLNRGAREAHVAKVLYSYLWMSTGESTQQGKQEPEGRDADLKPPEIGSPCFRWYGQ